MLEDDDWASLVESVITRQCTPFLGAGVGVPHLPLGPELAESLAAEYDYPLPDRSNLARVAQYASIRRGAPLVKRAVIKTLEQRQSRFLSANSNRVPRNYEILADLGQERYVSTNYDGFMERALVASGKSPVVEVCRWRDQLWDTLGEYPEVRASADEPILFYLHGRVDDEISVLVTEDDYIDFTVTMAVRGTHDASQSPLWSQIRRALGYTKLLFIGYSLEDWNFRILLKYLVKQQGITPDLTSPGFSIQLTPTSATDPAAAEKFLQEYFRLSNIRVFWADASKFLEELKLRVDKARAS